MNKQMTRNSNLVSRARRRLPSPAMIVALAALVMSTGGTVTAAALVTSANIKDNTIRSVDIRDETIKGRDVDNGTLTGADIRNRSVTGVDVKNGSVTGLDVNESTFGQVPSAANATNAQNAGKVDGLDANTLNRVALKSNDATLTLANAEQIYGTPVSITAPRAGFVMIHATTTFRNVSCTTLCGVEARLHHVQSDATSPSARGSIAPGQGWANVANAWVFPVAAGVNTFDVFVMRSVGDGIVQGWTGELAATYSPFGPTGAGSL
jgi:hypothetical protein